MRLEEALKIWRETGRKIRPIGFSNYRDPHVEFIGYYLNSEYEVEPEPKKTVVMYKWAAKNTFSPGGVWFENIRFFENESDFRKHGNYGENYWAVKRLDYTATEFEV